MELSLVCLLVSFFAITNLPLISSRGVRPRSGDTLALTENNFRVGREIDATDVQSNLTVADDERSMGAWARTKKAWVYEALDDERDIDETEAKVSKVTY